MRRHVPRTRRPPVPVIAVICAVGCATACAAGCSGPGEPDTVHAELRTARDHYPTGTAPRLNLVVRNDSTDACSMPRHGIGSLRIRDVRRDGAPVPSRSRPIPTFAPAIDAVRAALTDIQPGSAMSLDVEVDGGSGAPASIRSHRVAESGGMTATVWPVTARGRYRVTAALDTPPAAQRPDRAPLCTPPGANGIEFTIR
ncbi:hypothetical protein [Gordonia zhaorongruii]|uniref:hypothetical protein n=1 Tax=Gordonia zhaorongruii TaxID=2597659 RepID=UPI00117F8A51|nr:hypothetical protein [Gordonia zhaorongruii]